MGCQCVHHCHHKQYTFMKFLGDCFMTIITAGLWLIWVFFRWLGNR